MYNYAFTPSPPIFTNTIQIHIENSIGIYKGYNEGYKSLPELFNYHGEW